MTVKVNSTNKELENLQKSLQSLRPTDFEALAVDLLTEFVGVLFRQAQSGGQQGADATASGPRELRLEARRYRDNTALDRRGIKGQIIESLKLNPNLEGWILATTRAVPDQVSSDANDLAAQEGIAFVSLDWSNEAVPRLAALCSEYKSITLNYLDSSLEGTLDAIKAVEDQPKPLKHLKQQLESWSIGYETTRERSQQKIELIWTDRSAAEAHFNQNVAGGDPLSKHIRRDVSYEKLRGWYENANSNEIIAVLGRDGAGKTWAVLDWMQSNLLHLPIVVTIPSSSLGEDAPSSMEGLKRLIATQLHSITSVRDISYWDKRISRLLSAPVDKGPCLLLFFDGLNEAGGDKWIHALRQFATEPFKSRIRVIVSTRQHHYKAQLNSLTSIRPNPISLEISSYDLSVGGEFDKKLGMEKLSRDDINPQLLEYARIPRFFDLVIKLRTSLHDIEKISPATLLWEYGRETLFEASRGAFSQDTFEEYVLDLGNSFFKGNEPVTARDLGELVSSKTISPNNVAQRVSVLINGLSAKRAAGGKVEFDMKFVTFALALAVLDHLRNAIDIDDARGKLQSWLDTISDIDQTADILDAASSLAVTQELGVSSHSLNALVSAWVQSQNITDDSLLNLNGISTRIVEPLLTAMKISTAENNPTAVGRASRAISGIDISMKEVARLIGSHTADWLSNIQLKPRNKDERENPSGNHHYGHKLRRIKERVGLEGLGTFNIAGHDFHVTELDHMSLVFRGLRLLQDRPLSECIQLFEVNAIRMAVDSRTDANSPVSWLARLNNIDPVETAMALRTSAEKLKSIPVPVEGVVGFRDRIWTLVLSKTGFDIDEKATREIKNILDFPLDYEESYLKDPASSNYKLERRHCAAALLDTKLSIVRRCEKTHSALTDPTFSVPGAFVTELVEYSQNFDVETLNQSRSSSREDLWWRHISIALARCAPEELARIEKAKISLIASRDEDKLFGSIIALWEAPILVGEAERTTAQVQLAKLSVENYFQNDFKSQAFNTITGIAIQRLSAVEQVRKIVLMENEAIWLDLITLIKTPSSDDVDLLIEEMSNSERNRGRLIDVLAHLHLPSISENAASVIFQHGVRERGEEYKDESSAFSVLFDAAPDILARKLVDADWRWGDETGYWRVVKASSALIKNADSIGVMEVLDRAIPCVVPGLVSMPGVSTEQVRAVAELIGSVVFGSSTEVPDLPTEIIKDVTKTGKGGYDLTVGAENIDPNLSQADQFSSLFGDPDKQQEQRKRVFKEVVQKVSDVRKNGSSFYLREFELEDMRIIVKTCPDIVERWLSKIVPYEDNIRSQLRLAEGLYRSLCEVLLSANPKKGIELWHVLRSYSTYRARGLGAVDDLVLMIFRADDSEEVISVRDSLYDLAYFNNNTIGIDLVIAARAFGHVEWLKTRIEGDINSDMAALRERGAFMNLVVERQTIDQLPDCPEGWAKTGIEHAQRLGGQFVRSETLAYHWFQKFIDSRTPAEAYSTFRLLEACADRRCHVWMDWSPVYNLSQGAGESSELSELKRVLIKARETKLYKAIDDKEKDTARMLGSRTTVQSLWPWDKTERLVY